MPPDNAPDDPPAREPLPDRPRDGPVWEDLDGNAVDELVQGERYARVDRDGRRVVVEEALRRFGAG